MHRWPFRFLSSCSGAESREAQGDSYLQPANQASRHGTGCGEDEYRTLAFDFVHFADGSPAWGGPENFHIYVTLAGATHRSSDLDATGYWQIPINGFPAPPIRAAGQAWVTHGSGDNERRVSENFDFDINNGT